MAVRKVEYIISLRDKFSSKLAGINKNLKVTGQKIQAIGTTLSLAVTLPIAALGATAVKLASDFEETESKFFTVFSSIRQQADDTAKNLRTNFGLSSRAALQLLGDTGDLLVGFGFTEEAALKMSKEVNELAVDLASFTNVQGGAQTASAALTKALLGERESVKSLGISILESDVKARVLLNTQRGLVFASNRQAKAVATLQIATDQSSKAIGDFARTSQSFANQMRITRARLEDLSVQIGKILLPLAQKLLRIVKDWIERFSALDASTKKIIVVVAGLAAAIGPLLLVLGVLMTTVIPGLITAFGLLRGAFLRLSIVIAANPIGALITLLGLAAAALLIFRNNADQATKAQKRFNEEQERLQALKNQLKTTQELFAVRKNISQQGLIDLKQRLSTEIRGITDIEDREIARFKSENQFEKLRELKARFRKAEEMGRQVLISQIRQEEGRLNELIKKRTGGLLGNRKELERQLKIVQGLVKPADIPGAPAGITPIVPAAPTRIVSAAPRTFNINIEKLVETINNNVTNIKEGMNESKKIITEALLGALNDSQVLVR